MTDQRTSTCIRILVADDNALTRLGIVTMLRLERGFEVVGEASDGAKAITSYRELRPDVLVLDLRMPVLDGVQVTSDLCREDPAARVLVLSHYDGDEDIFRALRAGAKGYLTKEVGGEELVNAVRTVAAGGRYMVPEVANRLAERVLQPSLTVREQQVLEEMARGFTNKQIAESLTMSDRTVGTHVSQILSKLGAKTRTEAVTVGMQKGLLKRG